MKENYIEIRIAGKPFNRMVRIIMVLIISYLTLGSHTHVANEKREAVVKSGHSHTPTARHKHAHHRPRKHCR
jgi:hypothetical protein